MSHNPQEVEVDVKIKMTINSAWTVSAVQSILNDINEQITPVVCGDPEVIDIDEVMMKNIQFKETNDA
jgi:hypothetical protein